MKKLFLLTPYILYSIGIFSKSWFIFVPNFYMVIIFVLVSFSYFFRRQLFLFFFNLNSKFFLVSFLAFIFLFPVRNLNLGDGILLLESVFIEAKLLGFQLVMDEFLTTWIQSKAFLLVQNWFTVRESYSLVSYIFGIACLMIFYHLWIQKKTLPLIILILNGGFLVFQGYAENYSIPFFFLLVTISYGYHLLKQNQIKIEQTIFLSILASISVLSHLVNGYMIFGLIFAVYQKSSTKDFLKKSILCSFVSLSILFIFFTWFKFFSNIRIESSQTHFFNPPFYPLRKIISMNHFKEIIQCILFSSLLPFTILFYFYFYKKVKLKQILNKPENKFLFLILIGFLLHSFLLNPLLGFPSDWDLMSFFYFPSSLLAVILWKNLQKKEQINFIPLLVFSILIYIFTSFFLNQKAENDEKNLALSMNLAQKYIDFRKNEIKKILPQNRKFFIRIDYFLYKKLQILEILEDNKAKNLINSIKKFKIELKKISTTKEKRNLLKDLSEFNSKYTKYIQTKKEIL